MTTLQTISVLLLISVSRQVFMMLVGSIVSQEFLKSSGGFEAGRCADCVFALAKTRQHPPSTQRH